MADLSLQENVHPFLQKLSQRHQMILMSGLRPFSYEPGEYLIREGEPANSVYLIRTGKCVIEATDANGKVITIQTLGSGSVLGWSWLVPPYDWQFSCRVEEEIEGLAIDASWLREQCEEDVVLANHVYLNLMRVLTERLFALRKETFRLTADAAEKPTDQIG